MWAGKWMGFYMTVFVCFKDIQFFSIFHFNNIIFMIFV